MMNRTYGTLVPSMMLVALVLTATVAAEGLLGVVPQGPVQVPTNAAPFAANDPAVPAADATNGPLFGLLPHDWTQPLGTQDYWQNYFDEWRAWKAEVDAGQQKMQDYQATWDRIQEKIRTGRRLTLYEVIVKNRIESERERLTGEARTLAQQPFVDGYGQLVRNGSAVRENVMEGIGSLFDRNGCNGNGCGCGCGGVVTPND